MKRLLCILLACLMVASPVYAGNGEKMGKKQKTKEQIEIEKAENEKKYQMFDSAGHMTSIYGGLE